jgi:trehalose-6-phosphate synthase
MQILRRIQPSDILKGAIVRNPTALRNTANAIRLALNVPNFVNVKNAKIKIVDVIIHLINIF